MDAVVALSGLWTTAFLFPNLELCVSFVLRAFGADIDSTQFYEAIILLHFPDVNSFLMFFCKNNA